MFRYIKVAGVGWPIDDWQWVWRLLIDINSFVGGQTTRWGEGRVHTLRCHTQNEQNIFRFVTHAPNDSRISSFSFSGVRAALLICTHHKSRAHILDAYMLWLDGSTPYRTAHQYICVHRNTRQMENYNSWRIYISISKWVRSRALPFYYIHCIRSYRFDLDMNLSPRTGYEVVHIYTAAVSDYNDYYEYMEYGWIFYRVAAHRTTHSAIATTLSFIEWIQPIQMRLWFEWKKKPNRRIQNPPNRRWHLRYACDAHSTELNGLFFGRAMLDKAGWRAEVGWPARARVTFTSLWFYYRISTGLYCERERQLPHSRAPGPT